MFRTLISEIDSFFDRDPAARSRLEVVFCYPGFHAMIFYRMSHWFWRKNIKLFARWLSQFARFLTGIEIHPGAVIGKRFFIDHGMGVVIGETAQIGDYVTIYHGVTLGGVSPADEKDESVRHPQLGNGVIVGSGAQLLGAIKVGDGAKIGSNAVVVSDVHEGSVMVGVPAREVRSRKKAEIDTEQFIAYGTQPGATVDPRQKTIDKLVKELHRLQNRVEELEEQQENIEKTAEKWKAP